jgi:hypothetical protein
MPQSRSQRKILVEPFVGTKIDVRYMLPNPMCDLEPPQALKKTFSKSSYPRRLDRMQSLHLTEIQPRGSSQLLQYKPNGQPSFQDTKTITEVGARCCPPIVVPSNVTQAG